MDTEIFWNMIETARKNSGGDIEKQFQLLVEVLSQLPETAILEFERILYEVRYSAYLPDLWEAADFIACGCSDDGFLDFRAWLIAQGKTVFDKALEDPESLVEVVEAERRRDVLDGRLMSVAPRAFNRRTSQEMPLIKYDLPPERILELGEEDRRDAKFPLLVAKLGGCDEWWEAKHNTLYGERPT